MFLAVSNFTFLYRQIFSVDPNVQAVPLQNNLAICGAITKKLHKEVIN